MPAGPRTTFHDSSLQVRSVVDIFDLLNPKTVTLLKYMSGGSDEKPSLNSLSKPCKSKMFEWVEDEDPPFVANLAAAIDDDDDALTVTTAHAAYLIPGTVVKIDDEFILVGLTATLANPIPITRGFAGTDAAAHAANATVTIISQTNLEEKDAPASWTKEAVVPYNYVQLFEETISVTEMAKQIEMYGADNALDRETAKKTRRLYRLLNRTCYHGVRYQGTTTVPSMMGGLKAFIPQANVTALNGGTLETDTIEDAMRNVFDQVGGDQVPDTLICNSFVRTRISKVFANSGVVTYRDQKERRGGVIVDYIDTHFGSFDILTDHDCPADELYLLRGEKMGIGPLNTMTFRREPLARTGPVDKFMIFGGYTLQMRGSKCHGLITGISLTNP